LPYLGVNKLFVSARSQDSTAAWASAHQRNRSSDNKRSVGKLGRSRTEHRMLWSGNAISVAPRITATTRTIDFRQLGGGFGFWVGSFSIMGMDYDLGPDCVDCG